MRWEDPPEDGRKTRTRQPSKWIPIAQELKSNPGRWALIADDKSHGYHIYARKQMGAGFEVITRKGATRRNVYARYVGEDA